VAELAQVYAELPHAKPDMACDRAVTPAPVAASSCAMLLADTIRQVGPAPADLPRITIYDPCCGVGVVLAEAASRLPRHTPDG
jgi:hypothetical protein